MRDHPQQQRWEARRDVQPVLVRQHTRATLLVQPTDFVQHGHRDLPGTEKSILNLDSSKTVGLGLRNEGESSWFNHKGSGCSKRFWWHFNISNDFTIFPPVVQYNYVRLKPWFPELRAIKIIIWLKSSSFINAVTLLMSCSNVCKVYQKKTLVVFSQIGWWLIIFNSQINLFLLPRNSSYALIMNLKTLVQLITY